MKNIKLGGVSIKPHLLIGTDSLTGEYVVASGKDCKVKIDFTVLFMTIAERNNKSYEELAQLTAWVANYLSKNYPFETTKVISDEED